MSDSSERNQELENTTNHFCIDPEESYVFKLFFTSKKFYGLSMHLKNYKSNFWLREKNTYEKKKSLMRITLKL